MSRKDSRGMFANVLGQIDQEPQAPQLAKSSSPHLMKVAAGVRQIQERGEVLDRLLRDGEHIVELDPQEIAPSPIPDRFSGAYDESAVQEIAASMSERGQIVPGLVRPVQGQELRYQIVFGRRRLAAARSLGTKFKAVVRELTDEQAIVFQGEENTNRNDLSFIEKCAFALSQEKAGYGRDVICASLSTGKSHISEMLRIASTVPLNVLLLIGPAQEVGRRRWLDFAEKWVAASDAAERVQRALGSAPGMNSDSFALALAALEKAKPAASPSSSAVRVPVSEVRAKGLIFATVNYSRAGARMNFSKVVPADFVQFLSGRMEELHDEYLKKTDGINKGP